MSPFLLVTEYGTPELSVFQIDVVIVNLDKVIVRLEKQRDPKC